MDDARESSLLVYMGLPDQELNNAEMVDAANLFEQELKNYNVEDIQDFTMVPIQAQPLNTFGNESLVKQIEDSLKYQINVSDSNYSLTLFLRQYKLLFVNKLIFI